MDKQLTIDFILSYGVSKQRLADDRKIFIYSTLNHDNYKFIPLISPEFLDRTSLRYVCLPNHIKIYRYRIIIPHAQVPRDRIYFLPPYKNPSVPRRRARRIRKSRPSNATTLNSEITDTAVSGSDRKKTNCARAKELLNKT